MPIFKHFCLVCTLTSVSGRSTMLSYTKYRPLLLPKRTKTAKTLNKVALLISYRMAHLSRVSIFSSVRWWKNALLFYLSYLYSDRWLYPIQGIDAALTTHMSPSSIQSIFLLMPSTVAHECTQSDTFILMTSALHPFHYYPLLNMYVAYMCMREGQC